VPNEVKQDFDGRVTLRNKLNSAEVVVPIRFVRGYVDRTPAASHVPDPTPIVEGD
jgi:hypothetical protein